MARVSRKRKFAVRAATAAALTVVAPPAPASPLFELVGAVGGDGGYSARTTGASAASTYFNPALLPDSPQEFGVGVLVVSDQIGLTLDGRKGGVVPNSVGDRQAFLPNGDPISNATVPTDWLENGCRTAQCQPPFAARPRQANGSSAKTRTYTSIGLVSRLIKDRLVLGLYALVPNGDFTTARSFYNDEREQFFSNSLHPEFYSDCLTATSLAFGAGSRVFSRLSVGVSFTLNLKNIASAQTYVRDSIDYDKVLMANDIHVKTSVSPHFGLAYTPLDWLKLTGTMHTEQRMTIATNIVAALPSGQESGTNRSEVHDFLPWKFSVGGVVDVAKGKTHVVSLVASVDYALWSDYVDRHAERPSDEGARYAFRNTFSETVGVRVSTGALRSFLDLTYQPTPVPAQTGRRNYVDNDRLGAALGADYGIPAFGVVIRPGLQLQGYRLPNRYQAKDDRMMVDELPDDAVDAAGAKVARAGGLQTNNPGWPGFASEGWILGCAATVALVY